MVKCSDMKFFLLDQTHTLASMLREALEETNPEALVSCTVMHPLNTFLEVHAPSERAVRVALQHAQDKLAKNVSKLALRGMPKPLATPS